MFWSIKSSGEVLSKLKSKGVRATTLSTYFLSIYIHFFTTLLHNFIKLLGVFVRAFKKIFKYKGTLYLACNDKKALFTSTDH